MSRAIVLYAAALMLVATRLPGAGTSYFRHDDGRAKQDAAPLPTDFADENHLAWRVPLLPGNSSPCVYGDKVYLTTFDKKSEELTTVALDRKTGQLRWTQVAKAERIESTHPVGSPASCTPACDGERLYVFFGSLGLLCYDLDGNLLWSKPMGPFQDEFGASSSPVIAGNRILINEDHDVDCFLMAIDARTGKTVWKIPREGYTRSYSTPVLLEGGRQVLVAGSLRLTAYDVETGDAVWWVDGLSRIVDSTPVRSGDRVFVATWTPGGDQANRISMEPYAEALKSYDKNNDNLVGKDELPEGAVLTRFFRIDLNQDEKLDEVEWKKHARVFDLAQNAALSVRTGGRGNVTDTHVDWSYRKGLPTVPSSLVYRDVLYMVKDSGIITSLDAKTGELLKQGRARGPGNYYASLVGGDGKVFLCSERGVVTVLTAGREWSIAASHDFGERIMATPTIVDGSIFLRTDSAMYRFEGK